MLTPHNWKDYELIDSGDGMKLERWANYVLARPDPQALWPKEQPDTWKTADGIYTRNISGGGSWEFKGKLAGGGPDSWQISYENLVFSVKPTDFKHTGIFPEQAVNWDWLQERIKTWSGKEVRVLNLFAYTGAATIACAAGGAKVTHVDASKGIVSWARENAKLTGIREDRIRWIVDDVFKFVKREAIRGVRYDGIIMDPPSYGRGTAGKTWRIEKMLWPLVEECASVISETPLFFLINTYTSGLSPTSIGNILESATKKISRGTIESFELGIQTAGSARILPAGACARWEAQK